METYQRGFLFRFRSKGNETLAVWKVTESPSQRETERERLLERESGSFRETKREERRYYENNK